MSDCDCKIGYSQSGYEVAPLRLVAGFVSKVKLWSKILVDRTTFLHGINSQYPTVARQAGLAVRRIILEQAGYEVVFATDTRQALEMCQQGGSGGRDLSRGRHPAIHLTQPIGRDEELASAIDGLVLPGSAAPAR